MTLEVATNIISSRLPHELGQEALEGERLRPYPSRSGRSMHGKSEILMANGRCFSALWCICLGALLTKGWMPIEITLRPFTFEMHSWLDFCRGGGYEWKKQACKWQSRLL